MPKKPISTLGLLVLLLTSSSFCLRHQPDNNYQPNPKKPELANHSDLDLYQELIARDNDNSESIVVLKSSGTVGSARNPSLQGVSTSNLEAIYQRRLDSYYAPRQRDIANILQTLDKDLLARLNNLVLPKNNNMKTEFVPFYDTEQFAGTLLHPLTKGIVALVNLNALESRSDGSMILTTATTFGKKWNLCQNHQFYQEPILDNNSDDARFRACSGFIVGENLIATARHCLRDLEADPYSSPPGALSNIRIILDYKTPLSWENQNPRFVAHQIVHAKGKEPLYDRIRSPLSPVYLDEEKQILADWVIIETEEKLDSTRILPIRKTPYSSRDIQDPNNNLLFVISHAASMPQKVAIERVLKTFPNRNSYKTDLALFKGASGAPVFWAQTKEVVGILLGGTFYENFQIRVLANNSGKCTPLRQPPAGYGDYFFDTSEIGALIQQHKEKSSKIITPPQSPALTGSESLRSCWGKNKLSYCDPFVFKCTGTKECCLNACLKLCQKCGTKKSCQVSCARVTDALQ